MNENKVISLESTHSDGEGQAAAASATQSDTGGERKLSSLSLQKSIATQTPQNLEFDLTDMPGTTKQLMRYEPFVNVNTPTNQNHAVVNIRIPLSNNQALDAAEAEAEDGHTNRFPIVIEWHQLKTILDLMTGRDIKVSQDQIDSLLCIGQMPKMNWLLCPNGEGHTTFNTPLGRNDKSAVCCGIRSPIFSEIPHLANLLLLEPQLASSFNRLRLQPEMMAQREQQNEEMSAPSINGFDESQILLPSTSTVARNEDISQESNTQSTQTTPYTGIGTRSVGINTVIHLPTDLAENNAAWIPQTLKYFGYIDPDYTVNKIRGIFNKLTPANFDKLAQSASYLPINSVITIKKVVALIVEKTTAELMFAMIYCKFIKYLFSMPNLSNTMFKVILIDSLEEEFFMNVNNVAEAKVAKLKPIIDKLMAATDPKMKQEIKIELDDEEYQFRRRAWGTVSFIGELCKMGFLTARIVCTCLETLLYPICEDKLEFMCKLLASSGHQLETDGHEQWTIKQRLDVIFVKLRQIIENSAQGTGPKISNRVRFMIQDIVDLRVRRWNKQQNQMGSLNAPAVPSGGYRYTSNRRQGTRSSRASMPNNRRKNKQQSSS